ncbi:MAG: 7-cyano-7-deazaguanine synthase QueC [Euryarchaeota archaeon]|nr:7-cyano-7-deazaguanine synthase QueC [Euryarchaeota archaeon]
MRVVALLSSGMDSVVAAALASKQGELALALTFDYGQRAAEREVEYSARVCEVLGVRHRVLRLEWLAEITSTALVNSGRSLPELAEEELDSEAAQESARQVWVPNRNGVFVNIGASFAEALGCEAVVVGFDAEEAATFPDNSREYVEAANRALGFSTLSGVRVHAPLVGMSKSEIAELGLRIGAPLEWSWSCYTGGEKPCMRCESCMRRARAFRSIGRKDPLLERLGL